MLAQDAWRQVLRVGAPSEGSLLPPGSLQTPATESETRRRPRPCNLKAQSHVTVTHHWLPREACGRGSRRGTWPHVCALPADMLILPSCFQIPFVPICSLCRLNSWIRF